MAAAEALKTLLDSGLVEAGGTFVRPAPDDSAVAALPDDYRRTLSVMNGFTVYNGIYRLFGVREERHLDVRAWNAAEGWRFAWDDRIEPFFFIGESAFGEQYAFRRTDSGSGYEEEIYLLEPNFMQPEIIATSFEEFLIEEMLRNATAPYDEIAVEAVARLGPVGVTRNLVYTPSIALGGPEDVANLMEIDAYAAMIYAGDIALAIDAAPPEAHLRGVEGWIDQSGRSRIRVVFD